MKNRSKIAGLLAGPLGLLVLSAGGCAAPPPDAPVMPPKPPRETIQSSILPPDPTPLPVPSLPKGILLNLSGNPVSFEDLPEITEGTDAPTILVQAEAATKYREVERVLDRLHELGYLIEFQAIATP